MKKHQKTTQNDSVNDLETSFIDGLRELGFSTGAEALERQKRERIAKFIRSKAGLDNPIVNSINMN